MPVTKETVLQAILSDTTLAVQMKAYLTSKVRKLTEQEVAEWLMPADASNEYQVAAAYAEIFGK
jgi:hypothetical protein